MAQYLKPGFNITASDIKPLLEQYDRQRSGIRTWRQLFGNASLGANAQTSALTTDYSSAIAEAYKSNLAQQDAILGAGLSTGLTRDLIAQNRADLHAAYETHVRNFGADRAAIAENYAKDVSAIDTALNERAANFSNLYNSAYKYLAEELYGAIGSADVNYGNDYFVDHDLSWALYDDGSLKDWNVLSHDLFDNNDVMTERGKMFFDQMFNATNEAYLHTGGDRAIRSFDQWLSDQENLFDNYDATNLPGMAKNGQALREWWISQDDFNYNFAGTNKGTANVFAGQESTNEKFDKFKYVTEADLLGEYDEKLGRYTGYHAQQFETDIMDTIANDLREKWNAVSNVKGSVSAQERKNALDALHEAQRNYSAATAARVTQLYDTFERVIGSDAYDRFILENNGLLSEIEDSLKQVNTLEVRGRYDYDMDVIRDFNVRYNRLMSAMRDYVKRHGYTGKTSGF